MSRYVFVSDNGILCDDRPSRTPLPLGEALEIVDTLTATYLVEEADAQALDSYLRSYGRDTPSLYCGKRPKTEPKPGYVYLMFNGIRHKIGASKSVDSRRRAIEYASGMPIVLLACKHFDDMYKAESRLLEAFDDVRERGEWFNLSEAQVAEIMEALS